jgi:alpha-methylacyl-CoA racemase
VLSMTEAAEHPHNVARHAFTSVGGVTQPSPAPRFSATPAEIASPPCRPGENGAKALAEWGIGSTGIDELISSGVVRAV